MARVVAYRIGIAVLLALAFGLLWCLAYEIVVGLRWAPSRLPGEGASRWALLRAQNADRSADAFLIAWNHLYARLVYPATQAEALVRAAIAAGAVVATGLAGAVFAFVNRRQMPFGAARFGTLMDAARQWQDEELGDPPRWDVGALGIESGRRLLSRKSTEAIHLAMREIPDGLAMDRIGREPWQTSVRAAAISATQLVVQRAALELDVAPEEFETLEPRLRQGRPMLQFADFLVNGSGFCRHLAEAESDGRPTVLRLVRSMLDDADRLVEPFLEDGHRADCARACYRCLQRYGNRAYHGLLDWRLGLGFLRAMVDVDHRCGLDGDWTARELRDWNWTATTTAEELQRLRPTDRTVVSLGGLPGLRVRKDGAVEHYVVVHSFWRTGPAERLSEPLRSAVEAADGTPVWFVDAFDAARRPVRALHVARSRPSDR